MCDRIGKAEWKTNPKYINNALRVQNREELEEIIEIETKKKTTAEWLEVLNESGMPYAAVNDIQGTMNHEHGKRLFLRFYVFSRTDQVVLARDMVKELSHPACGLMKFVNTPVKYSYSEPSIRLPPPLLGQHTDEVLKEIVGMDKTEVEALRAAGVVA